MKVHKQPARIQMSEIQCSKCCFLAAFVRPAVMSGSFVLREQKSSIRQEGTFPSLENRSYEHVDAVFFVPALKGICKTWFVCNILAGN